MSVSNLGTVQIGNYKLSGDNGSCCSVVVQTSGELSSLIDQPALSFTY